MKHKNLLLIVSTLLLIAVLTGCVSVNNNDEDVTAGTSVELELKNKSANYIANEITELRKQVKKDKSLTTRKDNFENLKKENYKIESELTNTLLDSFVSNANSSMEHKGYIITGEFKARYVVDGLIRLEYAEERNGTVVYYDVELELIDNHNIPRDPSMNSDMIMSHTELTSATDISTIRRTLYKTWATNGTARADSLKEAAEIAINKISREFELSFVDKLM